MPQSSEDFYLRTGKRVIVNSGTRSPEAQADAMLGNRTNWGIYKDQRAVAEICSAFERPEWHSCGAGCRDGADHSTAGVPRCLHFGSSEIERFGFSNMGFVPPRERSVLVEVSRKHGKRVPDERLPPHVHVKY